ncbi:MAG TPA: AAA family ATPase [Candidatus Polarisedimenticolaceae bacterium]
MSALIPVGLIAALLVCAYLLGRRGGRAVPAPSPQAPDAAATLYRIAGELVPFFQASAHPKDLLDNPGFRRGVDLLRGPSWSAETLLGYYAGDNAVIACLALEALCARADDVDVRPAVLAGINDFNPWNRYFSLRLLAAKSPVGGEPIVGRLLMRLNDSWLFPANLQFLREFLATREAAGEPPTLGTLVEGLNDASATTLGSILERLPGELAGPVAAEIAAWRVRSIDREFLASIGRLWTAGEGEPLVEHAGLAQATSSVLASILAHPSRSVLLVGEHGVGKSAVARRAAEALLARDWTVFETQATDLLAGMSYLGELEERVRDLVAKLRGRPVLWYVPGFHMLTLAGRHRYGPASLLDMILPHVDKGEIVVLGETSPSGYERVVQSASRVPAAFEVVRIEPTSSAATLDLVTAWSSQRARPGAEALVDDATRHEAWQLAQQYRGDRAAPGNVLELLERTLARLSAGGERPATITLGDLVDTLGRLTGLPATILDPRAGLDVASLRAMFERHVLGQPEAVDCLVERVAMVKAGVTDPKRPLGVFLFAGPTGTGKTEIAKTLARFLFGSPDRMIRLDMSEFQGPESLNRLLGESDADAGRTGAALVDRIRKEPFSVILLDEVEKAHEKVWDLFLQVFDDGRLTDRQGATADFRNAIVILTSNLGAAIPSGASLGFLDATGRFSPSTVLKTVEKSFRKEFLNRLDRIVVFRPLARETMRDILRKELTEAFERRGLRQRAWAVEFDAGALDLLLERGFTADLGARPLKRSVERHLLAPLALTIVEHRVPEGDQFLFVKAEQGRLVVEFIDPDAPDPAAPAAPADAPAGTDRSPARIAVAPAGTAAEIAALARAHARLEELLDAEAIHAAKGDALSRMREPAFWESPDRFALLGRIEQLDRIESGVRAAGSLLERLESRERAPRDLVGRLAMQLHLLDLAVHDAIEDRPSDAFVAVEAWGDAGSPSRDSNAFAARVAAMYRAWADRRGIQVEDLPAPATDGVFRAAFGVAGHGAFSTLSREAGLHVLEIPEGEGRGERRAIARVRVVPQPDGPADGRAVLDAAGAGAPSIVRRYRELPSPLVRDVVAGWRSGKLDRVLAGDFDLIAAADARSG